MLSLFTIHVSAETKFSGTDELDDVYISGENETLNLTSFPNVDIKDISINREGETIDLVFNLKESGTYYDSGDFIYMVILQTSSNLYKICYGTVLFLMGLAKYGGFDFDIDNESLDDIYTLVFTEENPDLNILDDSNIDGNSQTFTFDLVDSNEVCVGFYYATVWYTSNSWTSSVAYIDVYPNEENEYEFPTIDGGGKYYTNTGENFELTGSINSTDTDYRYIWTFEDSAQTKTGKTITHRYLEPGNFTGTLFVSDPDTGKYGESYFDVQVNGTAIIDPDEPNNQPGFEIIAFISAFAIALIFLRKKRKK